MEWLLVADGLVWVFKKLLINWDFYAQPFLGFTENGPKKRKYPVSGSSVDENVLFFGSHITLQPKTGCPLKLSRVEPGQYLDGRPPGKTRLLLEEVLVRPAGGAHPVVCVGPNAPV